MSDVVQIVWFKRDLRVADHRPLAGAAAVGPVLPLYVVEPELWAEDDASHRQWSFVAECVDELTADLAALGQPLVVRVGAVIDVLEQLRREVGDFALWSHQETGNDWTYARDRAVLAWCRAQAITWHEVPQGGVVRRLANRRGWAGRWDRLMTEPLTPPPALPPLRQNIPSARLPSAADLHLDDDGACQRQRGGRRAALATLDGFLTERGLDYRRAMSSPVDGETSCSRVSAHLAWGTLAMREVHQATELCRQRQADRSGREAASWRASLKSYSARLHWHCHFMQKLEDQPRLEFEDLHSAYRGLRPQGDSQASFDAWCRGETGLPFVDACMRMLQATGWLNFRMRAMLMAVASYHLWLDWRQPGLHLARLFTDYEPGIHWSQAQMQSGSTGINAVRIYNPVKQGHDQDPDGQFVRQWVPELAAVPDDFIHEPWQWAGADQLLDRRYPRRVVDHLAAAREAKQRIWAVRRGAEFRAEARQIFDKHGSRKRPQRRRAAVSHNHELPFGDEST
ncbi:MAG: FAD-binding domain-containing protein [Pseudomonadota bacterium]